VGQAVEILNAFNNVLTQAMIQIRDLGNRSAAMLMPAPGSLLLKMRNEGVYGWKDKSGGMHVIRAKVAGYPDFMGASGFPYLKEYEGIGFLGFEKCWQVIGQQAGDVHITASRYDSDIPSGWWSFRYRANPLQPEFDKAQLGQLIGQVQLPSAGPVWDGTKYELNAGEWPDTTDTSFVNLMNVSVSSGTKAHYGRNKTDIYINKEQ
jgi:hypothetical protein